MQFLSIPPEHLLQEPIGMNHFLSMDELSTVDDGDPFI
jgi:hypothetical protein